MAEAIAKAAPGARVVKGFLASDDADAKKQVSAVATQAGFRPVDAGPLRNAAVLENVAMLWIHLATVGGQGRDFTFVMQSRGKVGA